MERNKKAEQLAPAKYTEGYTCPEAILLSLREEGVLDFPDEVLKASTGFGAGIGLSKDLCGCISGAVIAIGLLYGRTDLNVSRKTSWNRCYELVKRFQQRFGSTKCAELIADFDDLADSERIKHCGNIIEFTTSEVKKILLLPPESPCLNDPIRDAYFHRREKVQNKPENT